MRNLSFMLFIFQMLTTNIGFASTVLKTTDAFRLSWREFAASSPGKYTVSISASICAAEEATKSARCAPVGKFDSGELDLTTINTVDIKKNTEKMSGGELNRLAQSVSVGMRNPIIRLSLTLSQDLIDDRRVKSTKIVDEKYVVFPSLSQTANNERNVLQEKVVLQASGLRSRVLVEVYRNP